MRECQSRGREASKFVRVEKAKRGYAAPSGVPPIVPDSTCWDCEGRVGNGVCQFNCASKVNIFSFPNVSNYTMLVWLYNHNTTCNRANCSSELCFPVALGEKVGLKCQECGFISKGGL